MLGAMKVIMIRAKSIPANQPLKRFFVSGEIRCHDKWISESQEPG
jgi:hypothetical protein